MKARWAAWIFAAAAACGARAAIPPLREGEQFVYSVAFGIIPGAGRITVTADDGVAPGGAPILQVVSETETRGLAHLLLPFRARAESLYDEASGRLIWLSESSETRGKRDSHTVTFDYIDHQAAYVDPARFRHPQTLPLPEGDPMDLINALLAARTWNLVPGQTHDELVLFEDDFYLLTVHALRYEDVDTPVASGPALLLEPRMEKTPPKGMFRKGSTVRVWIERDGERLPLKFQVQFKVGSGIASLISYRPAAAASSGGRGPASGRQR